MGATSRGIGGSRRKIAKKIAKDKRCYANTLLPRSRMLLKGDEGGLGGVVKALTTAYEDVLATLGLKRRD